MRYNESKNVMFTRHERISPRIALNRILGKFASSDDISWSFDRVRPAENTYAAVISCPDRMDEQLIGGQWLAADKTANQLLESFANILQDDPAFEDFESAEIMYSVVFEGSQKTHIDFEHDLERGDGQFRALTFSDEKFYHNDDGSYCDGEFMLSSEQLLELAEKCEGFQFVLTVYLDRFR